MRLFYNQQLSSEYLDQKNFKAWESNSIPMGNGYFGACVFGGVSEERIQITENSLANPYGVSKPGLNYGLESFGDIFIKTKHSNVEDYERSLTLDTAQFECKYTKDGVAFCRNMFLSRPDNILVYRVQSSEAGNVSLSISFSIPFLGQSCAVEGDGFGRSGSILYSNNLIEVSGKMSFYQIEYCAYLKVIPIGGHSSYSQSSINVEGADEVLILFSCGTNYKLSPNVFLEEDPKKKLIPDSTLNERILSNVQNASRYSYEQLFEKHLNDYQSLYGRVALEVEEKKEIPTDVLVSNYKKGIRSIYLETLLFQYGRYLLICSSREGSLPANLQGIWSAYDSSPWSAGYWHNINVQMNYWPSGPANLSECFLSYSHYAEAYMEQAKKNADAYIQKLYPNKYNKGNDGWTLGTGGWPYLIEGMNTDSHSGPGTGAFTSLLFWDHYSFTGDVNYLKEVAYPALYGMSIFLSKCLIEKDGKYLINHSASPENITDPNDWRSYYHTIGCAFDQQLTYENFKRTIESAEILKIKNDSFIKELQHILPLLDPVQIGASGQVKEYREETYYSEIGEPHHRHISQLVGLYPCTIINANTPQWLKAAEYTLNARGDQSTGWATAHRLLAWTRIRNSSRTTDLLKSFVSNNVLYNLWDSHPPFQIDGNFGYTAAVCEMLVQSHADFVEILPCLPLNWDNGYFKGIKARGNYEVECRFTDRKLASAQIKANSKGVLRILDKGYKVYYKGLEITAKNSLFVVCLNAGETIEIAGK